MSVFSKRHPSVAERETLGTLLDEIGPTEVLRLVGQWIAHNHNDWQLGDAFRSLICRIANGIEKNKVIN